MPFYKRLSDLRTQSLGLVVAATEPAEGLQRYLSDHGLSVDKVISTPPGQIRFRGTPAILVVDAAGVVEGSWEGLLAPARESELLAFLQVPSQMKPE
jgi:hypothetical protein